jgi:cyclic beta-1,2-glucan synthetase
VGLGGIVGGAVAWYLDFGQLETIVNKFHAYASLNYIIDNRPVNSYVIRPLFSKWGATDLGVVDGSVRLFYDRVLIRRNSVDIRRSFIFDQFILSDGAHTKKPAPFSQLASWEGLDMLVENAVRVLRWGLWMAPVIVFIP